jgi:DNA-binding transcriptional LysR family regulator
MDVFDAADAFYGTLATLPVGALSRAEAQALLERMDKLEGQLAMLDRRILGRLITQGTPTQFGGRTWTEVLSQRLRISPAEAQRRIAGAVTEDPSAA